MAVSKYPALHRLITEVQETLGVKPVDGFIGKDTEKALARALTRYDGNDVIGFLSDYAHHSVVHDKEVALPIVGKDVKHIFPWLAIASAYEGLEEIVGNKHNEEILKFWELCRLPFRDDETPWCAGFVGGCLEQCGIQSTRSGMARSYLKWGRKIDEPVKGCIVVFWRGHVDSPSGHVGFFMGKPSGIHVYCLGGNQGNRVCTKKYPAARVLGYRLPTEKEGFIHGKL